MNVTTPPARSGVTSPAAARDARAARRLGTFMTTAIFRASMTHAARGYESVDPAPPAPEADVPSLERRLLDRQARMFERMRALFTLRAIATHESGTPRGVAALDAMGRCLLEDPSALLRHEAAFIFGQISSPYAVRYLVPALEKDPHPMVRH